MRMALKFPAVSNMSSRHRTGYCASSARPARGFRATDARDLAVVVVGDTS